jgi:glycine/sarcosine N-methyltransferase
MRHSNDALYDEMADSYHLIFEDWQETIDRQSAILSRLLPNPAQVGAILDCACGIGTQTLGLAKAGFTVEGSDLSAAEVERAKAEAASRNLQIDFRVDDMRTLETSPIGKFGAVLAFDNALPHLDSDEEIRGALAAMRDRLRSEGKLLVSLRDYAPLMTERPAMMPPRFYGAQGNRRIVHQVWDWRDERRYTVHIFISQETSPDRWATRHFMGQYRAVTPEEVASHARKVGFVHVEVLGPSLTGYYQPIVSAIRV